jgi:signal transduction histidine kinase
LADISLIEAGRVRLDLEELKLEDILDEVVQSLQHRIAEKRLVIGLNLAENLPLLWADQIRLNQILTNLLSNAIKYSAEGGEIQLSAKEQVDPSAVLISVTDSGLGIKPEDQAQVFSKYFRSNETRVRAETGTGLGLNIAKLLVELQQGEIGFVSEYGVGSTFTFTVPIKQG